MKLRSYRPLSQCDSPSSGDVMASSSSARLRRCEILLLEPREDARFELASLLQGGNGIARTSSWVALAPHLGDPVVVDQMQREMLGRVSPTQWQPIPDDQHDRAICLWLLQKGLLISDSPTDADQALHRESDEKLRQAYWHPLAAVLHAFTRWQGVDAVKNTRDSKTDTAVSMREVLGPPPEPTPVDATAECVDLPLHQDSAFDDLLARRATCRNFDDSRPLPLPLFSTMLARVFGARASVQVSDDLRFQKKNSPSGGGLHPTEAYLIVQNVEGIAAGLYRYLIEGHRLVRLPDPAMALPAFAMEALGQQHWFANAHCLVIMVPRFDRTFWKYRRHAKGYRVVALEAGHLSQTLYLSATDLGLGAFITGAINERALEGALHLDPVCQGALAMCGFGWRAASMETAELDPAGKVWTRAG